jgi:hypothetical protein
MSRRIQALATRPARRCAPAGGRCRSRPTTARYTPPAVTPVDPPAGDATDLADDGTDCRRGPELGPRHRTAGQRRLEHPGGAEPLLSSHRGHKSRAGSRSPDTPRSRSALTCGFTSGTILGRSAPRRCRESQCGSSPAARRSRLPRPDLARRVDSLALSSGARPRDREAGRARPWSGGPLVGDLHARRHAGRCDLSV